MQFKVYVDGACSNNQHPDKRVAAYACMVFMNVNGTPYKKDITGVIPGVTNNHIELIAVARALELILSIDKDAMPEVEVISDSQYVVTNVNEHLKNWKANGWRTTTNKEISNKEQWIILDGLLSMTKYKFTKVTGDNSDKWNAQCDTTARRLCGSRPKQLDSRR